MKQNDKLFKTILFILQLAKEEGIKDIDYTALVKYVYLFDCFYAEENNGKHYTEIEWKFLNFGPYCGEFQDIFNIATKDNRIIIKKYPTSDPEKDNSRLGYKGWQVEPIISEISSYVKGKVKEIIKDFSNINSNKTLNELLHYVYFKTEPMKNANHKDILEFRHCTKLNYKNSIKPIESPKMNESTILALRSLLFSNKRTNSEPLYDDLYEETLNNLKPIYQYSENTKDLNKSINFSGFATIKRNEVD